MTRAALAELMGGRSRVSDFFKDGEPDIWPVTAILGHSPEAAMVRRQTLKKIGGSVAAVLPKSMLDRFQLDAGDEVYVVETSEGLLITPFDPDFADAMKAYGRGAKKFWNALRSLSR